MFSWVASLDAFLKQGRLRYLGLGLTIAWVYCTWFSPAFFPAESQQGATSLHVSLVCSAVGLLVLAFRPNKQVPLGSRSVLGASTVVSATTLLFFFANEGPILLAASALGGLASSVLWVAWGELFCSIDAEVAESSIPASLAVFVTAVLATYLLPFPVSGLIAIACPLLSCVMLLLGKSQLPESFAFAAPEQPFARVLPSLAKLALCSMVCSAATGFVVTSFSPANALVPGDSIILFYAVGGLAAGCVAAVALAHASRLNFSFLYELAIPLIVVSLSLRALNDAPSSTLAVLLACTAALYVEVLFFAIFARITHQGLCLPSETFGIFRSVVQLGFLAGGLLGTSLSGSALLPCCLTLICLCVVMLPLFLHLQKRFESAGEIAGEPQRSPLPDASAAEDDVTAKLASDFKLSARETEVLEFLAKGRSVPYMREAMMISKSTIETHIKHIYAKTGVHSKQELIDLVESYRG